MWSARRIGQAAGKSAAEVNKELAEKGYLEGKPGAWRLTEEGTRHGESRDETNGHGGWARRDWDYSVWDDAVAQEISGKQFPGVTWFCDGCDTPLGVQTGFHDSCGTWTCTECAHVNDISGDNIQQQ